MKAATLKLMDDVLRIELRCSDSMTCATMEIEITKLVQGVSVMTYPDGATLARKRCSSEHLDTVSALLREYGWTVGDPPRDVRWIVTEGNDPNICGDGEFGVSVDGVPYLYYKWPQPEASGKDVRFREINKREFGEVIRRPHFSEQPEYYDNVGGGKPPCRSCGGVRYHKVTCRERGKTSSENRMFPIATLTDPEVVFPARVESIMPKWEEIPEDFKRKHTVWNRLQHDWFYCGITDLKLKPKAGVDEKKAMRHLRAIQGSYQPKHEHKAAAVAYLLSQWFEDGPEWKTSRPSF